METRGARVEAYGAGAAGTRLLGAAEVRLGGLLDGREVQAEAPLVWAGAEIGRVAARIAAEQALRVQK